MRSLNDFSVLVQPGLNGAGKDHWQTHWEKAFPAFTRVRQADWKNPSYDAWSAKLTEDVMKAPRPVVIIAHSAGTSLVMKWAFDQPAATKKVAGAFLVAPSDRDRWKPAAGSTGPVGFGKMILQSLPFPAMVVASRDDDRVSFDRAQEFAQAWGAAFVDAGAKGHIGSASKLGLWPEGLVWFGQFLAKLR